MKGENIAATKINKTRAAKYNGNQADFSDGGGGYSHGAAHSGESSTAFHALNLFRIATLIKLSAVATAASFRWMKLLPARRQIRSMAASYDGFIRLRCWPNRSGWCGEQLMT